MPHGPVFNQHSRKREEDDDEAKWEADEDEEDDDEAYARNEDEERELREIDDADDEDAAAAEREITHADTAPTSEFAQELPGFGISRSVTFSNRRSKVRKHDGSSLGRAPVVKEVPAPPDYERKSRPFKVGENVKVKQDYRPKYCACSVMATVGATCAMCTYFWSHADKLAHAVCGTLTEADSLRKADVRTAILREVPLTAFERDMQVFKSKPGNLSEAVCFAKDKAGNAFLVEAGTCSKPRFNQKKKKDSGLSEPQKLKDACAKVDIELNALLPDRSTEGQISSLKANVAKRLKDPFKETRAELAATEPFCSLEVDPVDLSDEAAVRKAILCGFADLRMDKSAGSDGHLNGAVTKGELLMAQRGDVEEAALRRIKRLVLLGDAVSLFTGTELVELGVRSPVFPSIKDELTELRKCFEFVEGRIYLTPDGRRVQLQHPRWRSTLVQSTIDHVVQYVLYKPFSLAEVALLQEGSVGQAVDESSLVGVSTSDEGLVRFRSLLDEVRSRGDGRVRSSDVMTGMDWSVGRTGALDAYFCLRNSSSRDERFVSAVTAQAWSLINSTYAVGGTWLAQLDYGVVQTGSLRTSQQDGAPRHVDHVLNTGVILDDDHMVADVASSTLDYGDDQVASVPTEELCATREFLVDWKSPFEERDVCVSNPEPIDTLGRFVLERHGRTEYELKKWRNSLISMIAASLDGDRTAGVVSDQIRSFRFENRFNQEALHKLDEVLETLGLTHFDVVPMNDAVAPPLGEMAD